VIYLCVNAVHVLAEEGHYYRATKSLVTYGGSYLILVDVYTGVTFNIQERQLRVPKDFQELTDLQFIVHVADAK